MTQPDLVTELLEGPYPCFLATLRRDGSPYSVVVWCAPEGEMVTVNAAEARWLENIRHDPRVSLVVVDTANILRHVGIDGRVVSIEPDEGGAHMDSLSQIYEGRPYQYADSEDERRFRIVIEPLRTRTLEMPPP